MKLYSRPLSPFASRTRVALYAKEIAFELVPLEMGWSSDPEFLKKNATGRIPVLELDDGTCLVESGAIVEYLDDAFAANPLFAKDAVARAQQRAVLRVIENDVLAPMMQYFIQLHTKAAEATLTATRKKLDEGLAHLERLLGAHDLSSGVTAVDTLLLPVRHSLESLVAWVKEPTLLDVYPRVKAYAAEARRHAPLAKVWDEMEEGLRWFMGWLAKQQPQQHQQQQ